MVATQNIDTLGIIWTFSLRGVSFCGQRFTFTFIHLADAFIQSDLQLRNTISDTLKRGK